MKHAMYADESGESTPKRYKTSPVFIVTGCLVQKDKVLDIATKLDHIKYKFWNDTDIVLRSTNIGRKDGIFAIFKDAGLYKEFVKDLTAYLSACPIIIISVLVDQKEAFKLNWSQRTVIKRSYEALLSNYLRIMIAKDSQGEFIQESSTPLQDINIYEDFFYLQSAGLPSDKITHEEVKMRLTSLSFVTKKNMDTLTQLADLLSYGLLLEHKINNKILKVEGLTAYQKMIRTQAKSKLYKLTTGATTSKQIYKNFVAQTMLP